MRVTQAAYNSPQEFRTNSTNYVTIPGLTLANFSATGPVLVTLEVPYGWSSGSECWLAIAVDGGVVRQGLLATGGFCMSHILDSPAHVLLEGQVRTNNPSGQAVVGVFGEAVAMLRVIES